jgi:short-subunit dehydrogenase
MSPRVALITGASSGIGRALAVEAVKRGFSVGLMARSAEALAETANLCSNQIKHSESTDILKVFTFIGDVCLENDCINFIEQSLLNLNRIDVLINNAGISMRGIFVDTELSVLKRLMDTNFWGTVYCTKYALPQLLQNKGALSSSNAFILATADAASTKGGKRKLSLKAV